MNPRRQVQGSNFLRRFEFFQRVEQTRFDGSNGAMERMGDLFERRLPKEPQQDDLPMFGRKPMDPAQQLAGGFLLFERFIRPSFQRLQPA